MKPHQQIGSSGYQQQMIKSMFSSFKPSMKTITPQENLLKKEIASSELR